METNCRSNETGGRKVLGAPPPGILQRFFSGCSRDSSTGHIALQESQPWGKEASPSEDQKIPPSEDHPAGLSSRIIQPSPEHQRRIPTESSKNLAGRWESLGWRLEIELMNGMKIKSKDNEGVCEGKRSRGSGITGACITALHHSI